MKVFGKDKLNPEKLTKLYFAVDGINYITLRRIKYKDITIPKGYIFDGVTVKAPFTMLFSNKDLKQGIYASCIHDWICQHKEDYYRKDATDILVEIWQEWGLEPIKAFIVKISVNIFQFFKGGWKR